MTVWSSRPIFVTSTFRDMHAERDWLQNHVFPELTDRLRDLRHHLEHVDLRWGIDSAPSVGEDERELLVLKVCLSEIDRCRPFFIGILGDRYGWQPPKEQVERAAQEAGFEHDVSSRSITDLEIIYGVLERPDQKIRSRFYFRRPLPYDEMPPEIAARYSDRNDPATDTSNAVKKLDHLKRRIELEMKDRVRYYDAGWDAARQRVTGLEGWGRQVVEDIWSDLQAELADFAHKAPLTWQEEEKLALEEFISQHSFEVSIREDLVNDLISRFFSDSNDSSRRAVCIVGAEGTGKSSIFAHLFRKFEDEGVVVLAHAVGVSVRSTQIEWMLQRWISELSGIQMCDATSTLGFTEDKAMLFAHLLGRVADRKRIVILVDALHLLNPLQQSLELLRTLQLQQPNVKVLVTCNSGPDVEVLLSGWAVDEFALPPLGRGDAERITRNICAKYHRTLNINVLHALLHKRRSDGHPAFFWNVMWLALAVEKLNILDEEDFERSDQEFTGAPEERLRQLLLTIIQQMPTETEELYRWTLDRAESHFGRRQARAFVDLIAVSRGGWRDSDLRNLIPRDCNEVWDGLGFASLCRVFRGHVVRFGPLGQWRFANVQFRTAVEQRNLGDKNRVEWLHALIVEHLLTLPRTDPIRRSETMYHIIRIGDEQHASSYYGGNLDEDEAAGATLTLAEMVVDNQTMPRPKPDRAINESSPAADAHITPEWVVSLLDVAEEDHERCGRLCHRMRLLHDALKSRTTAHTRVQLMLTVVRNLSRLVGQYPNRVDWLRDLAVSHERLAATQLSAGDTIGAAKSYGEALTLFQRLTAIDPSNLETQHSLSKIHIGLAEALLQQNDGADVLKSFRAAYTICKQLSAIEPANSRWQEALATSHFGLGEFFQARGEIVNALNHYRKCHAIYEHLADMEPKDVNRQKGMLIISLIKIGEVLTAQGDDSAAYTCYHSARKMLEKHTTAYPTNQTLQRNLAVVYSHIANLLKKHQSDANEALEAALSSRDILQRLVSIDPGNSQYNRDLLVAHILAGEQLMRAKGDRVGAFKAFNEARNIGDQLIESAGSEIQFQADLIGVYHRCAEIAASIDIGVATFLALHARSIAQSMVSREPENLKGLWGLFVSHEKVGDMLAFQGEMDAASAVFRESLDIAWRLIRLQPEKAEWHRGLAIASYKLAKHLERMDLNEKSHNVQMECRRVLRSMKSAGMYLDPRLQEILRELNQRRGL